MPYEKEFIPKSTMNIHAHPNDQEFMVAGTLAKWAKASSEIVSAPASRRVFALVLLLGLSLACASSGMPFLVTSTPDLPTFFSPTPVPPTLAGMPPPIPSSPKVILQRLQITYLGLDGHKLVGSGCPGQDGMGSIENYHFIIEGVDIDRSVQRVLVTGDNSTLTWESPCRDDWGLIAKEIRPGTWEVFIAPSLPSRIYSILFFYDDNTFSIGMVDTHY